MVDKMAGDSGSLDRLVKEHWDTVSNLEVKGIITHDQALIIMRLIVNGAYFCAKVRIMAAHTLLLSSGSIEGKVRQMAVDLGNAAALEKYMRSKEQGDMRL